MNKSITLDERLDAARALRKQGYNCSQCEIGRAHV